MRPYPSAPRPLLLTLAADVAVLLLLLGFGVVALAVHDAVLGLGGLGAGLEDTGRSVQAAFETAADGVGQVPLVGGELADQLRAAGDGTGGDAIRAGEDAQREAGELANTLGWALFGMGAVLLLVAYLPHRISAMRRFGAR